MSRFYDFNALELMEMAPISIFSRNKNTEIFLDDQLLERNVAIACRFIFFARKLERFEEEFNSNKSSRNRLVKFLEFTRMRFYL